VCLEQIGVTFSNVQFVIERPQTVCPGPGLGYRCALRSLWRILWPLRRRIAPGPRLWAA